MDPPFLDLNEEQPQQDHLFINLNTEISSSLSLSPPLMINHPPQDHGEFFYKQPQRFQLQVPLEADHKIFSSAVSCDDHHPRVVADQSESENSDDLKLTIWKNNDTIQDRTNNDDHKNHMIMSGENFDDSVKWTSSKMRMMRKMIITNQDHHQTVISPNDHHHNQMNFTHKFDQHQVPMKKRNPTPPFGADHSSSSSSNNNNNNTIRVCSDCNTTKTPLWRSGPRGPKSLCNACGIRQRKARRALAAAAAAANGTILDAASMKTSAKVKHNKEKKTKVGNGNCGNPQFKKRCKLTPSSRGRKKLLCFEDLRISMSKSSAFQRVFPQDEKDAAILLMALSYGLVHG